MNIGEVVNNKYEIEREISRGGFGIIFKGVDQFGKRIAIKTIDPTLLGEAKYIDMFQNEALNIARLNHQNIVQVYDIQKSENGQICIVMEYVDGMDLLTLAKVCRSSNKKLPKSLIAHIIAEVCSGLDFAHNRQDSDTQQPLSLVHQDVSLSNIMTTKTGEVKIIDFGLVNLKKNRPQKAAEVTIQGNIRYISPEQIKSKNALDRRSDIFSLGVVLFELLTGKRLVDSNRKQTIVETVLTGGYDTRRLVNDEIPLRLQNICQRALEHKPENRYQTANQMYRELMHYLILADPAADFTANLSSFIDELNVQDSAVFQNADEPFEVSPENAPLNDSPDDQIETPDNDVNMNGRTTSDFYNSQDAHGTNDVSADSSIDEAANRNGYTTFQTTSGETFSPDINDKAVAQASDFYSFVEDSEDAQKTIIDVVRLSARTHKKAIFISTLVMMISFLGFTTIDTFAHITPYGLSIYDYLFPPAIKIDSMPSGANVYLDNKLLPDTTPLSLDKVTPGVHKLTLTLPQYESIVKSINVPGGGRLHLTGEAMKKVGEPYVLSFKDQYDFSSEPSGASIKINGVNTNQKTPATVFWDVDSEPTEVTFAFAGMPNLSALSIHSAEGKEYISDKRVWDVKKPIPGKAHYLISGTFHRKVTLESIPAKADIYCDGSDRPVGLTGLNGNLMLKMGKHSITLKKKGYLSTTFAVDIGKDTQSVIRKDLLRKVQIFARDISNNDKKDLNAKIVSVKFNRKTVDRNRETPTTLKLRPYTHTAKLSKEGYKDVLVKIKPNQTSATVKMEPLYYKLTVSTVDAITSTPISQVQVFFASAQSAAEPKALGLTSQDGSLSDKLDPGAYQVWISKAGYEKRRKTIKLLPGIENKLTFRLTGLR